MIHHLQILTELTAVLGKVDRDRMDAAANVLAQAPAIFATAAGRSGCMVKASLMRFMHMGIPSYVIGEMATPSAHAGDVLLIGSGSGETETVKAVAAKAKKLGMKIVLVTIRERSSLADMADAVITIPAPTSKLADGGIGASAQPMGSLFEQAMLLVLDALVMAVMEKKGLSSEVMFQKHANLE